MKRYVPVSNVADASRKTGMRLNAAELKYSAWERITNSSRCRQLDNDFNRPMILSIWVVVSVQAVDVKLKSAGGLDSPEELHKVRSSGECL